MEAGYRSHKFTRGRRKHKPMALTMHVRLNMPCLKQRKRIPSPSKKLTMPHVEVHFNHDRGPWKTRAGSKPLRDICRNTSQARARRLKTGIQLPVLQNRHPPNRKRLKKKEASQHRLLAPTASASKKKHPLFPPPPLLLGRARPIDSNPRGRGDHFGRSFWITLVAAEIHSLWS